MEFLDSLDFQTNKRTNRVRSWYLYEQFKSLESNQLEAARKLKSRYHQEKVLRRELSERKARRALCDQFGRTESRITTSVRSIETKTSLNVSNDEFLEGCSQLEDEDTIYDDHSVHDELNAHDEQSEYELTGHEISQDDSQIENQDDSQIENQDDSQIDNPSSDFKSITDRDYSVTSVVENLKDSENITDEIKEELEFVKHGIAENITLQLETAKENIQCLEEFSEFYESGEFSEKEFCEKESKDSIHSNFDKETKAIVPKQEKACIYDNNLVAAWMKLVSFAYQIIKLNHGGNCYYDYSSQFLTAVLACDVIRRGFSRMCDILQPYVCPIVFVDDEAQAPTSCYENTSKKIYNTEKSCSAVDIEPCSFRSIEQYLRKKPAYKSQCCNKINKSEMFFNPKCHKKYNSENHSNTIFESRGCSRKYNTQNYSKYSAENRNNKKRIASDPLPDIANKFASSEKCKTHSTLWPSEYKSEKSRGHYRCPCRASVRNPMLKIAKYIDEILVHMDQS